MVAIQNIVLIVAAAGSTVVSGACWSVNLGLKVRGVNNVWERATATEQTAASQLGASTELEKYFPDCRAALQKLPKSNLPKYHTTGASVTFINPPQACLQDTTKVGTTTIESASFAVSGSNIVVSHASPAFLKAFESLFGSAQASQA